MVSESSMWAWVIDCGCKPWILDVLCRYTLYIYIIHYFLRGKSFGY